MTAIAHGRYAVASLYDRFYRQIGFGLGQWALGQPTVSLLDEMLRQQSLSAASLKALQLEKLQRLLLQAAQHVPFYRDALSAQDFRSNPVDSLEDFAARVPLLEKGRIQQNPARFLSDRRDEKLRTVRSGGSTGEPLVFYSTPTNAAHTLAQMTRARSWWGLGPGSRGAVFWGNSASFSPSVRGGLRKLLQPLKHRAANRLIFSAYDMSPPSMARYAERLVAFRPQFILGYASTLHVFAQYLEEKKISMSGLGVQVVISTSEVLHPSQRRLLEGTFNCGVANEYGLSEVGVVAHECRAGVWHTFDDNVVVETVPLPETPEFSEIVVTPLYSFSAPLIRYRTGDVVTAPLRESDCSCGVTFSITEPILGREHDLIVTPAGGHVHGELFTHIFDHVRGVRRFQVIQEKVDQFLIRIVKTDEFQSSDERFIGSKIAQHMGRDVKIDIRYCDEIPVEPSGKYRWVRSLVQREESN